MNCELNSCRLFYPEAFSQGRGAISFLIEIIVMLIGSEIRPIFHSPETNGRLWNFIFHFSKYLEEGYRLGQRIPEANGCQVVSVSKLCRIFVSHRFSLALMTL